MADCYGCKRHGAKPPPALATGLANFRDDVHVAGLIANRCGSERHAELIRDALPENLPLLATLKRDGRHYLTRASLRVSASGRSERRVRSSF